MRTVFGDRRCDSDGEYAEVACVLYVAVCVLCGSCLFGRHNVEPIEGDHTYLLRTTQPARVALHELHHGSTRGTKAEG
jgi:hypothetical protein